MIAKYRPDEDSPALPTHEDLPSYTEKRSTRTHDNAEEDVGRLFRRHAWAEPSSLSWLASLSPAAPFTAPTSSPARMASRIRSKCRMMARRSAASCAGSDPALRYVSSSNRKTPGERVTLAAVKVFFKTHPVVGERCPRRHFPIPLLARLPRDTQAQVGARHNVCVPPSRVTQSIAIEEMSHVPLRAPCPRDTAVDHPVAVRMLLVAPSPLLL